ncbi:MAG: RodZ domain-containing protein [Sterolibacterium sp.]
MSEPTESPDLPESLEPPAAEGVDVSPAGSADSTPLSYDSPGGCLREARMARGLSIADVAQSIKFSPRQIEIIERDDFDMLPGTTFVRGFIRGYAKLLKLDDQALLAMLDRQKPQVVVQIDLPQDTGAALPQPGEQRNYYPYLILLVILLVAGVGLAVFLDWPGKVEKPAPVASNATSTLQPPLAYIEQPPATPFVPGQVVAETPPVGTDIRQLIFVFEDKSWVEVKDATQRVIFAQINEPGTRQIVNGKPPFALVIGNASHVQLQFEDQQVDLRPHTKVDVARLTLE